MAQGNSGLQAGEADEVDSPLPSDARGRSAFLLLTKTSHSGGLPSSLARTLQPSHICNSIIHPHARPLLPHSLASISNYLFLSLGKISATVSFASSSQAVLLTGVLVAITQ